MYKSCFPIREVPGGHLEDSWRAAGARVTMPSNPAPHHSEPELHNSAPGRDLWGACALKVERQGPATGALSRKHGMLSRRLKLPGSPFSHLYPIVEGALRLLTKDKCPVGDTAVILIV